MVSVSSAPSRKAGELLAQWVTLTAKLSKTHGRALSVSVLYCVHPSHVARKV